MVRRSGTAPVLAASAHPRRHRSLHKTGWPLRCNVLVLGLLAMWQGLPPVSFVNRLSAASLCSRCHQRGGRTATAAAKDFRYTNMRRSGYANWISDQVMLGRYPYVEPSRLRDPAKAKARLAEILNAGVDVFVSLVAELPSQPQHQGKINGFGSYYGPVKTLASGKDPDHKVSKRDVKFLHFPIWDLDVPSSGQLTRIVKDLAAEVHAGRKLYIHCWGGRGRAATVGASLIGVVEGLTADQALDRVQKAYSAREQDGCLSPETADQVGLVRSFLA